MEGSTWNFPDPLSLNARKQVTYLLETIPADSILYNELQLVTSGSDLLSTLSLHMRRPSLTLAVAWAYRPLLIDLCARWLDDTEDLLCKYEALSLLVGVHEELYPILSSFLRQPQIREGPVSAFLSNSHAIDSQIIHRILLAYYRILRATPFLPVELCWDHTLLYNLLSDASRDRGLRWLAIRCYALQTRSSDMNREKIEREMLGEIGAEDCPVYYGQDVTGRTREVDGWMLPVLEIKRISDYRSCLLTVNVDYFSREVSDIPIELSDLSKRTTNVHGILFLRTPIESECSSSFVVTPSSLVTLRKVATNVSLRRPTLLSSTPSSGKSALLAHLSKCLCTSSSQIVTIHLADASLEPRALLGSYVSSSIHPGSFEWKEGILVKAMREGKWVVLKDIDRASNEVLGLLTPLVESLDDNKPIGTRAMLAVPNRGVVQAAESFALFATRSSRLDSSKDFLPAAFFGAQKWNEVLIPDCSVSDLRQIMQAKFPTVSVSVADALIDIWRSIQDFRIIFTSRAFGIRDLEKFFSRISSLFEATGFVAIDQGIATDVNIPLLSLVPHPSIREDMYLEARDIFFASAAPSKAIQEQRNSIASFVATKLGLSDETQNWLLNAKTPRLEVERDIDGRAMAVVFGRTTIAVDSINNIATSRIPQNFNPHKPAIRLLSQIAGCVTEGEPVLLTGETGTGKTSVISYLAHLLNRPLLSLNLSNQTESSDLIGGFRPVSAQIPAAELQQEFSELFRHSFSKKRNEAYSEALENAIHSAKWKTVVRLWSEAAKKAREKLLESEGDFQHLDHSLSDNLDSNLPRKRRKLRVGDSLSSADDWKSFQTRVRDFEVQHVLGTGKFAFQFVEGPLVKAVKSGAWVLLDEINLASSETLECLSALLQGPDSSITITELGGLEPVHRDRSFRLFACMNPATDVGKRELPEHIRAKFTELDVPAPDADQEVLHSLVSHYIGHLVNADRSAVSDVAQFYTSVKSLAESGKLADGSNHRPHYSMRSLSRALTFTSDMTQSFGLRRALWEGFTMAFTMVLNQESAEMVLGIARRTLLSTVKNTVAFLAHQIAPPKDAIHNSHVQMGPFWLASGPHGPSEVSDYIVTASVDKKLLDLARIVLTKRFPVLIEGPTSSGKTSAIQFLARRTGHDFIRINNHEHTDIQEYLGSYVTDPKTGRLVFRDGLLVRALRRGDWIVLDELNLAPTDVLEALNRLLDDNRELVIPETHEVIKPHPNFMLFATQNPPGVYAGRKVLSRALRNRFLEVHFDDVPPTELEYILHQRSHIPPSYSQRIVSVFHELQLRRQIGRIFEGKQGFATLRDLFRWADRQARDYQELAEDGYMLLAERVRHLEDKHAVKEVIEKIMKVSLSEQAIYDSRSKYLPSDPYNGIIWTRPMRRLYTLLSRALNSNEPVLLVGETGTGKTSVCQVYAASLGKTMHTVNCHQNTEATDIIGGLRPTRLSNSSRFLHETQRNGDENVNAADSHLQTVQSGQSSASILEWQDGPLVKCMRFGDVFLLDEISLADDSVLERINSVLEPSRTLVLAEKGGDIENDFHIVAEFDFKFVATMNPGGDFGKKELSPALRNRFTEIWVPSITEPGDLLEIVTGSWNHECLRSLTQPLVDFVVWIASQIRDSSAITVRDILSWVAFCNNSYALSGLPPVMLFVQGGLMTIVDGLSSLNQLQSWSKTSLLELQERARTHLGSLVSAPANYIRPHISVWSSSDRFHIGDFSILRGSQAYDVDFNFNAPTSSVNAYRLIRACQIERPVLLEGSPGVGKTSLVEAVAAASGQHLCRINLSEQTDLTDLFGSDLPVDGKVTEGFAWSDAEFLLALQKGHWVLLDEMNLASQSVLEGLNAVFDHRGTVYIPELDRYFSRHPNFRIFAAQNPLHQGSGRKGLPKSFLNRFTKVYMEQLSAQDLILICQHLAPFIPESVIRLMVEFNCKLQDEVIAKRSFAVQGSPWEFNLRDIMRWISLLKDTPGGQAEPWHYANTIYAARFRKSSDRQRFYELFSTVFGIKDLEAKLHARCIVNPSHVYCGNSLLKRNQRALALSGSQFFAPHHLSTEAALACFAHNWLLIVTGSESSGKSNFVRALASMAGQMLQELNMTTNSDISDLIGGFEQTDSAYYARQLVSCILRFIDDMNSRIDITDVQTLKALSTSRIAAVSLQLHDHKALLSLGRSVLSLLPSSVSPSHTKEELVNAIAGLEAGAQGGLQFNWIDGPLIRAMENGDWLLLENANMCSPSVLDRLNSLCESDGSLILTEKGADRHPINVHPAFRLVMTVNPQYGEISRAMRNRGIEVALELDEKQMNTSSLHDALRLPHSGVLLGIPIKSRRAVFDLIRRGLQSPQMCLHVDLPLKLSSILLFEDSLLSRLNDYWIILHQSEPIGRDVAVVFMLNASLPSYPHHMLRLIKSLISPLDTGMIDDLTHVWSARKDLEKFVEYCIESWRIGYRLLDQSRSQEVKSLNILMDMPFTNLPSDDSLVLCASVNNIIEAYGLALILQHRLLNNNSISSTKRVEHDRIGAYLMAIPDLLKGLFTASMIKETCSQICDKIEHALQLVHLARYMYHITYQEYADYSALYIVVGHILKHATEDYHYSLTEQTSGLRDIFTLNSGHGIEEIWAALRSSSPLFETQTVENGLQYMLPSDDAYHQFRNRALDLFMTQYVDIREGDKAVAQLVSDLNKSVCPVVHAHKSENALSNKTFASSLLALELRFIAQLDPCSANDQLNNLISLIVGSYNGLVFHYLRVFAYSRLLWFKSTRQTMEDRLSQICQVNLEWHRALWRDDFVPQNCGPSMLVMPILLQSAVSAREIDSKGIRHIKNFEASVDDHIQNVLGLPIRQTDRIEQIRQLLFQNITLICACFPTHFENGVLPKITQMIRENRFNKEAFISYLQDCNLEPLQCILQSVVEEPSFNRPESTDGTSLDTLYDIGASWLTIANVLLNLYVPNLDLDPARMQLALDVFQSEQCRWLKSSIDLYSSLEVRRSGASTNMMTRMLNARLPNCKTLDKVTTNIASSRETSTLNAFWKEVRTFIKDIVSPERMSHFVILAKTEGQACASHEQVIQSSIANFMQRLMHTYDSCRDLIPAIELALMQIRFGIRLISHATIHKALPLEDTIVDLLSFPSSKGVESLGIVDTASMAQGEFTTSHALLFKLLSVIRGNSDDIPESIKEIQSVYDEMTSLWKLDVSDEAEKLQESESLYRLKQSSGKVEELHDSEERGIEEIFPAFDEDDTHEQYQTTQDQAVSSNGRHINPFIVQELLHIHLQVFSGTRTKSSSMSKWFSLRLKFILPWVESHVMSLPALIDDYSLAFRFSLLRETKQRFKSQKNRYNFYFDPNLPEVKKAVDAIQAMIDDLSSLIKTWPEQLVLQHIQDRCNDLLSMRADSSVARLLGAMERLLLHTEDWEMYANRDNSLAIHKARIISLIIDWRKLELDSWRDLLNNETEKFGSDIAEWWFRLYDVIVCGARAIITGKSLQSQSVFEELDHHLETLTPLLETFLTSSPLGQFKERLSLFCSFSEFTHLLSAKEDNLYGVALSRSSTVLFSIYKLYVQYLPLIEQSLNDQRVIIESAIQGLTGLVNWRDTNVHALRQSTQKTHKQLFKQVRNYRLVIRQPVSKCLQNLLPTKMEAERSSEAVSEMPDIGNSTHFEGQGSLRKFVMTLSTGLSHLIQPTSSENLEELSNSIFTVTEELAKLEPPKSLTREERKRWFASLLTRKRRSFHDLLKEFKRIGIPPNPKPETLQKHRSLRYLMEQPKLDQQKDLKLPGGTEKIDIYYFRTVNLLPSLLQSAGNHHPDIDGRDLRRGISLFESAFSISIHSRSRLILLLGKWARIGSCVDRLRTLGRTGNRCLYTADVRHVISQGMRKLCELEDAMEELLDVAENIAFLSCDAHCIREDSLNSIRDRRSQISVIKQEISSIVAVSTSTAPNILFDDELATLHSAWKCLNDAQPFLREVARCEPKLAQFCCDILDSLKDIPAIQFLPYSKTDSFDIQILVNSLLVSVQKLLVIESREFAMTDRSDIDHVRQQSSQFSSIEQALRIDEVLNQLDAFFHSAPDLSRPEISIAIQSALPYLDGYQSFFRHFLAEYTSWTKSLFKLAYISGTVIRRVAIDGFCKPSDTEANNDTGQTEMSSEGVGLGQGEGEANISESIEDESQYEGLQGEQEDSTNKEKEEGDGGLEVDFDLAADMEDDFGDNLSDESQMSDLDDNFSGNKTDQIDQIDHVDHGFWEEPLDEGKQDDPEVTQKSANGYGEAEISSKEESEAQQGRLDEAKTEEQQETALDGKHDDQMDKDDVTTNELNQPEDDINSAPSFDEPAEQSPVEDENFADELDLAQPDNEEGRDARRESPEPDDEGSDTVQYDENSITPDVEDLPVSEPGIAALADSHPGAGFSEKVPGSKGDSAIASVDESSSNAPSNSNAMSEVNDSANEGNGGSSEDNSNILAGSGTQTGTNTKEATFQPDDLPVTRSDLQSQIQLAGDAAREVYRASTEIRGHDDRDAMSINGLEGIKDSTDLEYAKAEDTEMQALGPAQGNDAANLNDLNVVGWNDSQNGQGQGVIDSLQSLPKEDNNHQHRGGQSERERGAISPTHDEQMHTLENDTGNANLFDSHDLSLGSQTSTLDKEVEKQLHHWLTHNDKGMNSSHMWQMYESLTQSLSYSLCEQLRLILEPTKATRLMGDFRTGKRLNMKKIIPYVASNFTKDKIWLKRVKPSQREYQILIALDDSRSMAESHSIHLAFQTLALVFKAFSLLEAGELAIASFGEEVKVLHAFEDGQFSDQTGSKIVEAFTFRQNATNVRSLLTTSMDVLTKARERRASLSHDLWQLEIIISDGVCQDHEELRAVIRKAEEEHILIVFVVIDAHSEDDGSTKDSRAQNSIMNLNQATYKNVNGRLELHMERYLDSFPFEYFAIVKDVETLPDVLSATLRQFFERVSVA